MGAAQAGAGGRAESWSQCPRAASRKPHAWRRQERRRRRPPLVERRHGRAGRGHVAHRECGAGRGSHARAHGGEEAVGGHSGRDADTAECVTLLPSLGACGACRVPLMRGGGGGAGLASTGADLAPPRSSPGGGAGLPAGGSGSSPAGGSHRSALVCAAALPGGAARRGAEVRERSCGPAICQGGWCAQVRTPAESHKLTYVGAASA